MHKELIEAIEGRLSELRSEINKLEGAMKSLISDGHPGRRGGRGRSRGRARRQSSDGRAPSRPRRRRRQTRMGQRERQAQALNRIREHGSQGVTITALAEEMGVTRSYLYGRILPPLDAEITKPSRGVVAPKEATRAPKQRRRAPKRGTKAPEAKTEAPKTTGSQGREAAISGTDGVTA